MRSVADIMKTAWTKGTVVPGFNIPYLPMMEPVVRALRDTECFGLISVARLEWTKFEAKSPAAVAAEYARVWDERYTRLHLDHVPVIDEDDLRVDYLAVVGEALGLGYGSVMVDGSRLPLAENIAATRTVAEAVRAAGAAVEAELGMVLGHSDGPLPPYEELFRTGRGFTDPAEAGRFVRETGVDWLSVAVGSAHGAISKAHKDEKKVEARLDIDHLKKINAVARVPLVLHGGSGIRRNIVIEGIRNGIAKINIGTAIRQPYERAIVTGAEAASRAVYEATVDIIRNELEITGSARALNP